MSALPVAISPASPVLAGIQPHRWTAVEFDHLGSLGCFTGRRAFLLDGIIWEQGPMDPPHAVGISLVSEALHTAFGAGWFLRVQLPLHLDTANNPMPDIAVIQGRPRDYLGKHPTTAPLVVEVADTTLTTDTTVKAERYATAGIRDYWVLDLNGRRLLVYRDPLPIPDGGAAYRTHLTLGPAESVTPLAAPNAPIPVADLLP